MKQEDAPQGAILVEGPDGNLPAVTVEERIPSTLFVFPLRESVAFPNLMMPVLLDTEHAREIVVKAEQSRYLFMLTQKDPTLEHPQPKDFYEVGVVAKILKTLRLPDGNSSVMVQGIHRARIARVVRTDPFFVAKVVESPEIPTKGKRVQALHRKLQQSLTEVASMNDSLGTDFSTAVLNIDRPEQLADFTGAYFLKQTDQRQKILETLEIGPRVEAALEYVLGELELQRLGNRIQKEIREKVEKAQKDYFLREQLKIIRRELGEET
ncbi:MAG: LON peptidase substrate-binding domain-containing protein, partial [Planctomycetes bacterium]|nr:LON peptidase substrate-binding domain-containing protein [Planctomycetota bacterium]